MTYTVDQPNAIPMWVPDSITFESTDATWIVVHKTAGGSTAQGIAQYFINGSDGNNVSSHYVVGLDGTIVQCVPESRGAGANCCLESGHAPYLPTDINLNVKTISIEHVDSTTDNSSLLPQAQAQASFKLIKDICTRHNIPMRTGDASGGIIGHNDIAPQSRARCPGAYPWPALWAYLKGDTTAMSVPDGWKDDGVTLTAPNGVKVAQGFREWVLSHSWDSSNIPLETEYHADSVLIHNTALGGGQRQLFRDCMLWWTPQQGVRQEPFLGWELDAAYKQIAQLQAAIDGLKNTPPPPAVNVHLIASTAIAELQKLL